jgi:hypothetical protein
MDNNQDNSNNNSGITYTRTGIHRFIRLWETMRYTCVEEHQFLRSWRSSANAIKGG